METARDVADIEGLTIDEVMDARDSVDENAFLRQVLLSDD